MKNVGMQAKAAPTRRSQITQLTPHIVIDGRMNSIRLPAQVCELLRVQGLGAIAQGFLWTMVHFDHQAVGAHSRGCTA